MQSIWRRAESRRLPWRGAVPDADTRPPPALTGVAGTQGATDADAAAADAHAAAAPTRIREVLVMAKATGPRCNLRCDYCYYVGKGAEDFAPAKAGGATVGGATASGATAGEGPVGGAEADGATAGGATAGEGPARAASRMPGKLSDALLERYIAQRFAASPGPVTHFEWHGGEPTLLGLAWFKALLRLQKRLCPPGRRFTNGLQTNGLLLNEAWAAFLHEAGFSVGLSLDGPKDCHDVHRHGADGVPSHARVLRAFDILQRAGVFTNVLCVVNKANVGLPAEVYGFFRDLGVKRLQFLPLVTPATVEAGTGRTEAGIGHTEASIERTAAPHPLAAGREELGDFLCEVFDLWIASDVGRIIVQTFDEALRPIHGVEHSLCIHRETCGDVAVLETDGSLYACDHFVDPDHRLGSIVDSDLGALSSDPRLVAFGEAKREGLAAYCRSCEVLGSCNGGCPKDRISPAPDGSGLVAWFCPSWKRFFSHARPGLEALSTHIRKGRALRDYASVANR